ncbi:hypothetical protein GF325_15345 [Candidatus Bathyarchaeota archaeon]|nr:hypothetical protein [Candidatus Bathyarchaeota archaeon]
MATSDDDGGKLNLIFVYNADSGPINAIKDYFHKIFKPSTYDCNLCAVTFGNLGMKKSWKEFIGELECNVKFLHRDEFKEEYPGVEAHFPSAFKLANEKPETFITMEEMNQVASVEELIALVREKFET